MIVSRDFLPLRSIRGLVQTMPLLRKQVIAAMLAICFLGVGTHFSLAGDWPQILGPTRDGRASPDEKISIAWPPEGPRVAWRMKAGSGYSGAAVSEGKVMLFHRIENEDLLECLDLETGDTLWTTSFKARFSPTVTPDNGPRCVPLIVKSNVIVFSAAGTLSCVEIKNGKVVWSVDLAKRYSAPDGYFGFGSSPLESDGLIISIVGGRGEPGVEGGIVAVRINDGSVAWSATDEKAGYSAPQVMNIGETRVVVAVTRLGLLCFEPHTGKVHFRFSFGTTGPTVNAATPVVSGSTLFASSSYGVGLLAVETIEKNDGSVDAEEKWRSDDLLSSQFTTPLVMDQLLLGPHGRHDIGSPSLRMVDCAQKRVLWEEDGFGACGLIRVQDTVLAVRSRGELVVAKPDKTGFHSMSRAQIATGEVLALPALSDGRLLVRDSAGLVCLDLRSDD